VIDVTPPGTIQAAVDAAAPGDIVRINAGHYVEQVIVTKDLTLAAEPGATLVAPPGPLQTFSDGDGPNAGVLTILGADVDVKGLTVDGNASATPDNAFTGILFLQAGGSVTGCHITNVSAPGWPALRGDVRAFGTINVNFTPTRRWHVADNLIDRFNDFAVMAIGTGEDFAPIATVATIERNVIRGAGTNPLVGQFGILVFRGATGTIRGNYIDEMGTTNTDTEGGVGIHARFADGVIIQDNVLIHMQTGIRCHDTQTAEVVGNLIVGNPPDTDYGALGILCGGDGRRLIANNVVEGLIYGTNPDEFRVGIIGFGAQAVITANRVDIGSTTGLGPNGPEAILWFGDDAQISGNTLSMPVHADPSDDIFFEPVVLLSVGNRNQIVGNTLTGQRGAPVLIGIAIAGDAAHVSGNRFTHFPVGVLEVDEPSQGLVTTNAKLTGNHFIDVATEVSVP
jgi:hypothetical protein